MALALLFTAACSDDPTEPVGDSFSTVVSGVSTSDQNQTASFQDGAAPSASGSGPVATMTPLSSLIPGGTGLIRIEVADGGAQAPSSASGAGAFSEVILTSPDFDGFYRLLLPGDVGEVVLAVTLAPEAEVGTLRLRGAVGQGGAVGAYDDSTVPVAAAGTGEVQVSVSWDAASDVDLHVVTPSGEEIFYGNPQADGGELDIDSNAACSIDGVNQENITFESAPSGTYIVRVDYWDSCGVAETNYVVTVRAAGQQTRTFSGTFTGEGNHGGEGDGVEITQFTS